MEKYFGKLIKEYRNFLSGEGIQGKLQTTLVKGLENIFIQKSESDLLDKPFDYKNLFNENPKTLAVRISNCLRGQEIETYNDFAKNCYEYVKSKRRIWKNDESAYFNYLKHVRNLGDKSAEVILSHLKSINFNFSKEYAKEVYEKNSK